MITASLGLSACTAHVQAFDSTTETTTPVHVSTLVSSPTQTPLPPSATPSPTASPQPTPSPTPEPTIPPCWQAGGKMEFGSLRDPHLPLPMKYRVYLPPCYDQFTHERYPVLYLIHGMNYNDDQWDRLGADDVADELIRKKEIHPFLIVMPRDRSWSQPDQDGFGQAVIDTLIPYIDENYRTLPDRAHRALGGLSRGASWTLHLGLSHWELFGALGMHSLPVFWADTSHVRQWLDAIPRDSLPRIFMDTGDKDYLIRSTRWFENLLTQKNIPHEWYLFPGYHEEAYWSAHVEQYIRWYARDW
ncbi:MAG: alpha/beta hydrolase-fold protein [Anaerolineales bacterium]